MRYSIEVERINIPDPFGFLENLSNWSNHRPILLLALTLTEGSVLELGSGEGSTQYLRNYCKEKTRSFETCDNNKEWCEKTGAEHIEDWDKLVNCVAALSYGVIFIDHAPGERRALDTISLAYAADILVLHDTEEGGAGDYGWDIAWPHFKYRLNYNRLGGGAGATAVSNTIDLNRFRGLSLGQYTFDDD